MFRRIAAAILICVFAISAATARPARWCGWYARPRFNSACAWLRYGTPTTAHVGAIVVWCSKRHRHVGNIVGGSPGAWIVRSGNDGGRVRTRVRDVTTATAFRLSP